MMDGDMLEEQQTMGDVEEPAPKKPTLSQAPAPREAPKHTKEKKVAASTINKAPKPNSDSASHHQPTRKSQKAAKPAQAPKKEAVSEEMDVDADQLEEEEPEEVT